MISLMVPFGRTEPDRIYQIELTEHMEQWWRHWGNTDLYKIYRRHGINVFRRSTALLGIDRFAREHGFRGKRCIEIGTCKGMTAIVLARHFDEVVSFDIFPDDDKRDFAALCGINNIRFVDVESNAGRNKIIADLDFDAAYVDGNHAVDTEIDFKAVERCGHVLFHEYWPLQPAVWGLVNTLRNRGTVTTFGDSFALWRATA